MSSYALLCVFFSALARTLLIGYYKRVNVLGHEYVPIGIFALIALSFPILTFFAGRFFRPNNENALKNSTYECGEVPVGEAHIQFHFQYYMFAILFVVFDLVVVFLILWVQVYLVLSVAAKVIMMLFLLITLLGLWYAFRKEDVIWI
ncbi:MAG: NADH-quinone oxidoreductase subunit A [Methanobacteriota archaeon]|jgi:NADH:ubiquinone oxidoreductase subunit 3 (subunit A)|nr:MAG: NADH-quinone oxidoreductase subunit A [Euryarchaeota archaeon]|tara:strand:- start:1080 stop:1520 length:441 start_codon:yes stop_codon:yes gene_type:complete